jgi:hypothetical protein
VQDDRDDDGVDRGNCPPRRRAARAGTDRPLRPTEEVLAPFGHEPLPAGRIEPGEATLWVWRGGALEPVQIRTGLADAAFVEVLDGDLAPGVQVATRAAFASGAASPAGGATR